MALRYTTLISGSTGNAAYVESDEDALLLDAGLSFKSLCRLCDTAHLSLEKVRAILLTHEHSDHSKGVGVVARKLGVPIHLTKGTWDSIEAKVGKLSRNQAILHRIADTFNVGSLEVETFKLHHDAREPCGYMVGCAGKKVGFLTDTGHTDEWQRCQLRSCQGLVVEANHDVGVLQEGPYPAFLKKRILSDLGHLSNVACQDLLCQVVSDQTRYVTLAHLSGENNRPSLARLAMASLLVDYSNIELLVASGHRPLPLIEL